MDEEPVADEETFVEDEKFDRIYPKRVRDLSSVFWTPVAVAAEAAKLLVTSPGTSALDIGCEAGKFCLVGATVTEGVFTGVEQGEDLVELRGRRRRILGRWVWSSST